MSLPDDLVRHAIRLLGNPNGLATEADLRRAVSAAYYALFHAICGDAALLLAPDVPEPVRHRIQRWFDHGQIKVLCGRLTKAHLEQPLADLIGPTASPDLRFVASSFIELQEKRHQADYDPGYLVRWDETRIVIEKSVRSIGAWRRLQATSEANIFVLSLLVWKTGRRSARKRVSPQECFPDGTYKIRCSSGFWAFSRKGIRPPLVMSFTSTIAIPGSRVPVLNRKQVCC